jgi:hypothetical protein
MFSKMTVILGRTEAADDGLHLHPLNGATPTASIGCPSG